MERHGEEVDLTTTEARGGVNTGLRWMLLVSTVLVVVLLSVVWISGALTH
jgi:hypothetical protein